MERQEVFSGVVQIVSAHMDVPPEMIKEQTRFVEDLGADSLDMAEIGMECEDQFGDIRDDQNIKTVGQAVDEIMSVVRQEQE
jgi:acyl carrier protein